MLYKYLFYSVSFLVKKYDRFWKVGDTYFVGGGLITGMIIAITVINLLDIISVLFYSDLSWMHMKYTYLLPLILGLGIAIFLGKGKRHEIIYEEVANMPPKKKRIYKILNVIHIVLILSLFFGMSEYLRANN